MVGMEHPYIVAYRGSFREGSDMYILMDYYEGSHTERRPRARPHLSVLPAQVAT
jgi:hypothetical protein